MRAARDIRERVEDGPLTDYARGRLKVAPVKASWFSFNLVGAIVGVAWFTTPGAIAIWLALSILTLAGGHSLGMHRKLIHDSFDCPRWLERFGVHLDCLVGLGGPFTMMRAHDVRDWAQRQDRCHPFYSQHTGLLRDTVSQLFMRFDPEHPPHFHFPRKLTDDRWMIALQRTSMLQNVLLGAVLYTFGGWAWALWGVCVRVAVSMLGHSVVGWFAHNRGPQDWIKPDAGVQGHNVRGFGLLTFGEAYHNNHHAFPECANYGLMSGQWDAGYWMLCWLERAGLVWDVNHAPELVSGDAPSRRLG